MLELKNVSAGYGKNTVLKSISLKAEPGKVTAVGGLNGCGKSTLLKTAAGLITPTGGEILLNGESLAGMSPQHRARLLAYLPQGRNVPELTSFRMALHGRFAYLSFPRQYRKEDYDAARRALQWVGAEELAERSMSSLSGGQRQRIYIAMALSQDTDIILMDEPTTYLDVRTKFEVMELTRRLASLGKTVVMVLHDLDLMLRYADMLVLIDDGRVAAEGAPRELCHNGRLTAVFGVSVSEVDAPDGPGYLFRPRNKA